LRRIWRWLNRKRYQREADEAEFCSIVNYAHWYMHHVQYTEDGQPYVELP
jgi:hypothetical protein